MALGNAFRKPGYGQTFNICSEIIKRQDNIFSDVICIIEGALGISELAYK